LSSDANFQVGLKKSITAALYMHTDQQWAENSLVIIRKKPFMCLLEMKTTHERTWFSDLQHSKMSHTCPSVPSSETIVTE